jgi:hypothetical protein
MSEETPQPPEEQPVLSGDVISTAQAQGTLPPPPQPPPVVDAARQVSRATRFWGRLLWALGIIMLVLVVLAGIGGAVTFALFQQPPVTSDTTQSFAVTGPPRLVVSCPASDVHIAAGASDTVTVQVHKLARALTQDSARQLLDSMQVSATQAGDTITVTEQASDIVTIASQRQIVFTITVPTQTAIDANLSAGNLDATGVTGPLTIQESAGNVTLNDMTITGSSTVHESAGNLTIAGQLTRGATLDLENSAGNITFTGALATANTLTARESAGNVTLRLPQATSAHITARVSAGNLTIAGWPITVDRGVASASASGDTQPGQPNPTNTITVTNNAGNITISSQ